jgi:hypothetical protein
METWSSGSIAVFIAQYFNFAVKEWIPEISI